MQQITMVQKRKTGFGCVRWGYKFCRKGQKGEFVERDKRRIFLPHLNLNEIIVTYK